MFCFVASELFYFIYMILPTIIAGLKDDNLGCTLIPTISGDHYTQDELLDSLRHSNLYGKRYSATGKALYKYEFVVCGDVEGHKKPEATVVRKKETEEEFEVIGRRNATSVSGNKGEWVMLTFGDGDKGAPTSGCKNTSRSSSVMILCDKEHSSDQFELVYEDDSYCQFQFELRTAAVCEGSSGLSGWSIFFIILLVSCLVYFCSGFFYLRYIIGAKGIDQVPHRKFWFAVGNKLADGCGAVCRCNQYCGDAADDELHSPFSSGYSPIGEATPTLGTHTSQRDSPLLNNI